MAKQKLIVRDVKLIKHLLNVHNLRDAQVSDMLGYVSRTHVNHIKRGVRWSEVEQPTREYGEELYFRFLRKGTLKDEE